MAISVSNLSKEQLRNLIENHRRKKATDSPTYIEALQELEKLTGKGLDFEKSFQAILGAAKKQEFLTYKQLADTGGAEWNKVHYALGGHLWKLVEYSHYKRWPMLSAIVVNQQHRATGDMEPETLKGFISAARLLGHVVTDQNEFLRARQRAVFSWASTRQ
jgi:hypothetical protein